MRLLPAALLALLPLAACTRTAEDVPAAAPDTASAPVPYPDGGGPATTPLPADASTVSEAGFGPVRVGMATAAAQEAMGAGVRLGDASEGSTCRYLDWTSEHPGVSFMNVDGAVVRVDVSPYDGPDVVSADRLPRTATGIGVGSTDAEVRTAYAGRLRDEPHHYVDGGRYLIATQTPSDTSSVLIFETDGRVVTEIRAGRRPFVEWVEGCS